MSDQQEPPQPPNPSGDQPPGPGYWKASDGNWYPPQQPPQSQPPPYGQMQPTASQQYGQMPPDAPSGGMPGWAKGCLISVAVVAVFGLLGLACVAIVADDASEEIDQAIEEAVTTTAAEAEATTVPPVEESDATCSYAGTGGFSSRGMQVELTFTNPLGEVNGLEVTFALLDGEGGSRFYTGTAGGLDLEDISFPAANEQFRLSVDTGDEVPPNIDEATIGCTVLAIEEQMDIGGFQRSSDADTCTVLGTDSSGNIQVELAVTSPYEETTTVQTWWALQAPGSVRFETETEVVDLVGGGESFRISPQYGSEKAGWIGDGEVTCTVLGFWDQGR